MSVECTADVDFVSAESFLSAIDNNDECDISLSMLYAVAAAFEG